MHLFTHCSYPNPALCNYNNITTQYTIHHPDFPLNRFPLLPHLTRKVSQHGLPKLHRTLHIVRACSKSHTQRFESSSQQEKAIFLHHVRTSLWVSIRTNQLSLSKDTKVNRVNRIQLPCRYNNDFTWGKVRKQDLQFPAPGLNLRL